MNNRVDLTTERGLALAVDNLREISDMLVANAVTALPFPAPNATARNLRAIADALEALAPAPPTPPAAEAGTGFGRWVGPEEDRVTRLLIHAAMQECDDEYGARPSDELTDAAQQYRAWEYEQPEPDQDQEADHAR